MNTYSTLFLNNIKSAICIQTTAMYSTKVTAYLNIKRKWLQNCEVTYCDRCHVSVTKSFQNSPTDMSHKSLTAMSPTTSLSLFFRSSPQKKVQKDVTAFFFKYMTWRTWLTLWFTRFCTASMVFPMCRDSQRTLVFHIFQIKNNNNNKKKHKWVKCWQPLEDGKCLSCVKKPGKNPSPTLTH